MFLEILFVSSFTTSSARFSEFDSWNVILFQINVFGKNIKETMLAKCFRRVTACPSFTQLRVIRQINRVHYISKWEKPLQRFSCISFFFESPCLDWRCPVPFKALPPTQCCSILEEQQHPSLCKQTVSDTCKQHW